MNTQATYYRKNVYGNTVLYPANETAQLLTALSGTKTISVHKTIVPSEKLGFEWVEVLESSVIK